MTLEQLRAAIDRVDDRILRLLRERSDLVEQVGRVKEKSGDSYYAPEREENLLRRLVGLNESRLPEAGLRAIYREILSSMRALEQTIKVAYLGPRATFSHQAAARHFGSAVELCPERSIGEVFEAVERGRAHYGVVPIENSQEGSVNATLDRFMESEVRICAQVFLPVELDLLGRGPSARCAGSIRIPSRSANAGGGWPNIFRRSNVSRSQARHGPRNWRRRRKARRPWPAVWPVRSSLCPYSLLRSRIRRAM